MNTGTIKTVIVERGFGFIASGDDSLFFHLSGLNADLEFNEQLLERRVCFNLVTTPKGPRAVNVRAAD